MIDLPEVLEHLRAVVAAKGADYVYPESACFYAINGEPACIVGHVYARLGLLDKATQDSGASAWALHESKITSNGRDFLGNAQRVQDARGTWGEALAAAERVR